MQFLAREAVGLLEHLLLVVRQPAEALGHRWVEAAMSIDCLP
jgi:hypothetical protein